MVDAEASDTWADIETVIHIQEVADDALVYDATAELWLVVVAVGDDGDGAVVVVVVVRVVVVAKVAVAADGAVADVVWLAFASP